MLPKDVDLLNIFFSRSNLQKIVETKKNQFLSRGNVIKPKEATTEPYVHYECPENDSLWTLLLTNPAKLFFVRNEQKDWTNFSVSKKKNKLC